MASTSGRRVIVPLVNRSGGQVIAGDVVVIGDGTNDACFTTTTTASFNARHVGVAQETIASLATGRILVRGYAAIVNSAASLTRDHFLFTSTVAKEATGSATRAAGAFGQVLTTGTDTVCLIWGMPDVTVAAGAFPTVSSASVLTDQSLTGNNSWVDLTTAGPAVTVTVNTKVALDLSCHIYMSATASYGAMGFAASGANTIAAASAKSIQVGSSTTITADFRLGIGWILTGLTPGSTTITAKYNQLGSAGQTNWTDRYLRVMLLD